MASIFSAESFYEDTVKTLERWTTTEASDEEKLKFLEDAIKALGEEGNVEIFKEAMEELGVRAVLTDEAFYRVKSTMDAFVRKHGGDFPGILPFQTEWNGYSANWKEYITMSRDFAIKTASEYDDYTLQLQIVEQIVSKEDMLALAADLKEFSANNPTGIPVDFQDLFLDLKRSVENFQPRFYAYLDQQQANLTAEAETLKNEIEDLKIEVANLDRQVRDATTALKVASFFGLFGAAIAGTALAVLSKKRNDKQKELDGKKEELRQNEAKQTALAEIRAQFAGLAPDFLLLAENIGLFATTWNAFHHEALDFAIKFESAETPANLPALYVARVNAAIKVSVPLSLGLNAYASSIH